MPESGRWWLDRAPDELWAHSFTRADGSHGFTDGYRVVAFAESYCRYTDGENYGQLITLRPWQVQLLLEIFEVDKKGQRMYRRGLLGMPRKNGKSMLGACIALYALMADDEPGARVYSCAGDKEQAKIVFSEAAAMVEMEPRFVGILDVKESTSEIFGPKRSTYKALSAEAYTKEGLKPSMVIFDEVHVQPNNQLWTVMSMGSATRKRALILGITTAGWDKNTLCGKLYDTGRADAKYVDGAWRGRARGMWFTWFEPRDPQCDHRTVKVWRECNPGYGDFLIEAAVKDELEGSESLTENQFRRYRLNQWTSSVEAWLPYGAWDALAVPRELVPGETIIVMCDGSFSGDSTGIVACTLDGFLATLGVWERPPGPAGDGWRVDIAEVEQAVVEICKTYTVLEVDFDPFRWQRSMQALAEQGVPIVEFPTTSAARMVPACSTFYDAVMAAADAEGTLPMTHDGDEALARHVANAKLKTDRLGPRIVKEHKHSPAKIDLAVCAVVAYSRAMSQEPPEDNSPSIY